MAPPAATSGSTGGHDGRGATSRNAAGRRGRATFVVGEVPDVDLAGATFDRVLAARVAAMARPAALAFAARHLRPGGGSPSWSTPPAISGPAPGSAAALPTLPLAEPGFAPPTVDETMVDGGASSPASGPPWLAQAPPDLPGPRRRL